MLKTLIFLTAIFALPVWAQGDLPEADGKAVTVRICTGCHGAEMFSSARKSSNEWDGTITTTTEKGLAISDADYATVLDYLSKNLASPPRVNYQQGRGPQIERVLGVTAKQAVAIAPTARMNGDFKDLDALKKVTGLDAAVIDAKKSLIDF